MLVFQEKEWVISLVFKGTETGTFICFFGAVIIKWTVHVTRGTGIALYRKGIPVL